MATLVAAALSRPASAAGPVPPDPRAAGSVRDDSGLLGRSSGMATLRDRVAGAATRAGLPIAIVLVGSSVSSRDTDPASLARTARARFAEDGLFDDGTNDAVLLLVAPRAGQAVLETGKGEAGIVPEIDARRITADLRRALGSHLSGTALADRLAKAADQIAASALETRERRRPLAAPPPDERAETVVPSSQPEHPRASAGSEVDAKGASRRSLMPGAYALAIFVVLGLALRQRRRSNSRGTPQATRRSR